MQQDEGRRSSTSSLGRRLSLLFPEDQGDRRSNPRLRAPRFDPRNSRDRDPQGQLRVRTLSLPTPTVLDLRFATELANQEDFPPQPQDELEGHNAPPVQWTLFHRSVSAQPALGGRHAVEQQSKSPRFETNPSDPITDSLLIGGQKAYAPSFRTVVALTLTDNRPIAQRDEPQPMPTQPMLQPFAQHLEVPGNAYNPSSPKDTSSEPQHPPHTPEQQLHQGPVDPRTPNTPHIAREHQTFIHIPIDDRVEYFLLPHIITNYAAVHARVGLGPILIHCSQGVSRLQQNLEAAQTSQDRIRVILNFIREHRPCAGPKPWFIYQLLLLDRTFSRGQLNPRWNEPYKVS